MLEESTSSREDISGGGEGILVHDSSRGRRSGLTAQLVLGGRGVRAGRTQNQQQDFFLVCVYKDLKGLYVESFVEQAKDISQK